MVQDKSSDTNSGYRLFLLDKSLTRVSSYAETLRKRFGVTNQSPPTTASKETKKRQPMKPSDKRRTSQHELYPQEQTTREKSHRQVERTKVTDGETNFLQEHFPPLPNSAITTEAGQRLSDAQILPTTKVC